MKNISAIPSTSSGLRSYQFTKPKQKAKFGFTLVELSIAVTVLAVLAGVFAPVISQGIDVMLTIRTKETLLSDANLAMQRMSGDFRTNFGAMNSYATDGNGNSVLWFVNKAGTQFIGYRVTATQDSRGIWHQDLRREVLNASTFAQVSNITLARDVPNGGFTLTYFPALTGIRIPRYDATPGSWSGTPGFIQIRLILRDLVDTTFRVELLTRIRPGSF